MVNSIADVQNLPIRKILYNTNGYPNLASYPEIEEYYIEEFDKNFQSLTFEETMSKVYTNTTWDETKLKYFVDTFYQYVKDNQVFEVSEIHNFMDLFFLKGWTLESIAADVALISDPLEKLRIQTQYTKYYERFIDVFFSYASYLKAYLDIFEANISNVSVLKKDLLITNGRQIYGNRGDLKSFKYIKNIFSPLYYTNIYTNSVIKFALEIAVLENDQADISGLTDEQIPFVYDIIFQNLSIADLKVAIFDIIKTIVHPAGYKNKIIDQITFDITLKMNTASHSISEEDVLYAYFANETLDVSSMYSVQPVSMGTQNVDFVKNSQKTVNGAEINFDFNISD